MIVTLGTNYNKFMFSFVGTINDIMMKIEMSH